MFLSFWQDRIINLAVGGFTSVVVLVSTNLLLYRWFILYVVCVSTVDALFFLEVSNHDVYDVEYSDEMIEILQFSVHHKNDSKSQNFDNITV